MAVKARQKAGRYTSRVTQRSSNPGQRGKRGMGPCGHPVVTVSYIDDYLDEVIERLRCNRCGIVYLPEEA